MMAALFFRQVERCRSRQLYDALILPPVNHLVLGMAPSSTLSHFLNQVRLAAISPQKPAGSSLARPHMRLYSSSLLILDCAVNSAGGVKTRDSCRTLVIFSPVMVGPTAPRRDRQLARELQREHLRSRYRAILRSRSSNESSRRLPRPKLVESPALLARQGFAQP